MIVILQTLKISDNGTFGVFIIDDMPKYVTCELPWKNNAPNISCIPSGTYNVIKQYSQHFQRMVCVLQNVPGRSDVEIHIGNSIKDIRGCIIVGLQFSLNDYAIIASGLAFDSFMKMVPDTFTLIVKDAQDEVKRIIDSTQV